MKMKRNILFQDWDKCLKAQRWKDFWFWLVIQLQDLSTLDSMSNFWDSIVRGKHFSVSIRNSYVWCQVFSNGVEQLPMQILVKGEHLELWKRTRGAIQTQDDVSSVQQLATYFL